MERVQRRHYFTGHCVLFTLQKCCRCALITGLSQDLFLKQYHTGPFAYVWYSSCNSFGALQIDKVTYSQGIRCKKLTSFPCGAFSIFGCRYDRCGKQDIWSKFSVRCMSGGITNNVYLWIYSNFTKVLFMLVIVS